MVFGGFNTYKDYVKYGDIIPIPTPAQMTPAQMRAHRFKMILK